MTRSTLDLASENQRGNGGPPKSSVDDLLALDDEAFVLAAYQALLGREADEQGRSDYTAQVRAGTDKTTIIFALATSAEARQHGPQLTGLAELLSHRRGRDGSWVRRALRAVSRALMQPGQESTERILRALGNRIYRIEKAQLEQVDMLQQICSELAQLNLLMDSQQASPLKTRPGNANRSPVAGATLTDRQVPPSVNAEWQALRHALAEHRRTS